MLSYNRGIKGSRTSSTKKVARKEHMGEEKQKTKKIKEIQMKMNLKDQTFHPCIIIHDTLHQAYVLLSKSRNAELKKGFAPDKSF